MYFVPRNLAYFPLMQWQTERSAGSFALLRIQLFGVWTVWLTWHCGPTQKFHGSNSVIVKFYIEHLLTVN